MNDICTCPICFLPYDQVVPVVGHCGHTLCVDCSVAISHNTESFTCPVCEVVSSMPLSKNIELINLIEYLQLQLDYSTPRLFPSLSSSEVPTCLPQEVLLQEERNVLYDTQFKGFPVILRCLYSQQAYADREIDVLKQLNHPNILHMVGYVKSTVNETVDDATACNGTNYNSLLYEHASRGVLSTYFHSEAKHLNPSSKRLTIENRISIIIDILKALLYVQHEQRNHAHSHAAAGSFLRDFSVKSSHILLCDNFDAKVIVIADPHHFQIGNNASGKGESIDLNLDDESNGDESDGLLVPHDTMNINSKVKSIGYVLLEVLLNQSQECFPKLLPPDVSHDNVLSLISHENGIISQYIDEGLLDQGALFSLYLRPIYSIAVDCLDENKVALFPFSTRNVLLRMLHVRATIFEAKKAAKKLSRQASVNSSSTKKKTESKLLSPSISPAVKKKSQRRESSTATSFRESDRQPLSKEERRKWHHPGNYQSKPVKLGRQVISPSWRCCGKTSANAMGCVYDILAHHPGRWVKSIIPADGKDKDCDKKSALPVGVFDCCGNERSRKGCKSGERSKTCFK